MLVRHDGWSNPKVLTIFVVIFLCGAAIGAVGTREYLHSRMIRNAPLPPSIQAANQIGLHRLTVALNLSPQQQHTIERELDVWAKYYQNIEEQRADIETQRADVAEMGLKRILAVLSDDQKKRFSELFSNTTHK